jgi:AraC-like DNA-binding protein
VDTLSDVLRAVRLTGAVYFTIDASSPWVVETMPGREIAPYVGAGVEHVINYHVVTAGAGWAGMVGEPPFRLETGDVIVFPQGDAHVLSSTPGMRARPELDFYKAANAQRVPLCLSLKGGGPEVARVTCGFLGCDARPFNPLLGALPRIIHLPAARQGQAAIQSLVTLALQESSSPRPGSEGVLSRLSELLVVEVIRFFSSESPDQRGGWLAGLRDPIVGRALGKLHEHPSESWSLVRLAKEAGASRSVLAERFAELVGMAPMQYLARWRMQIAAHMLRTSDVPLSEVAERVGYGSEPALSRAFKRALGVSPASYRRAGEPPDPDSGSRDPDAQSF